VLPFDDTLLWLRAAAEATRLRLLALCAERELSVSDLAEALGQSEPRVSRHLRILTEAGLVERVRQGQWVHYRLAHSTPAAHVVRGLLGQIERSDPLLAQDRQRVRAAGGAQGTAPAVSRLGRELRAVLEAEMTPPPVSVLLIGVEHPELLLSVVERAGHCTALAHSRRAKQAARATLARVQRACRIVQAVGTELIGAQDVPRLGAPFEAVVIDHLAQPAGASPAALATARAVLAPGGRLWLFERYPPALAERVVEHPLAGLRRRLNEARLECQRIRPIEADGQHVLGASAIAGGALPASRAG
jgi:DNA-binding transcriptional ArsR family regulator